MPDIADEPLKTEGNAYAAFNDPPEDLQSRLTEFINGKNGEAKPEVKVEDPAAKVAEEKPKEEVKVDPPAKGGGPRGTDGLTRTERAEVQTAYKARDAERQRAEAAESKIKDYDSKVKDLEQKVSQGDLTYKEAQAKLKEWETKYTTLEADHNGWLSKQDKLALVQVQNSEVFQGELGKLEAQEKALEGPLEALCKGYEVSMNEVLSAHFNQDIVERDKKLEELLSGMNGTSRSRVYSMLEKIEFVYASREQLVARIQEDPKGALAAVKEAEETKQRLIKEREGVAYKRTADATWEHVIKKEFPLVEDKDVAARVQAKANTIDWANLSHDKKAMLVYGAFAAVEYRDTLLKQQQRIKELEASVKKHTTDAGMNLGHSSERVKVGADDDGSRRQQDADGEDMTVEESVNRWKASKGLPHY